jgi:hypothetical protein
MSLALDLEFQRLEHSGIRSSDHFIHDRDSREMPLS